MCTDKDHKKTLNSIAFPVNRSHMSQGYVPLLGCVLLSLLLESNAEITKS